MNQLRYAAAFAILLATAASSGPAHAFFHLWRFSEFFSTANGDDQFIELSVSSNGENFSQGAEIRSQSTGNIFTFPSHLPGNTANKRLLIATAGFGSLPGGVTPDFTLPSTDFFNPNGDTITLFASFNIDSRTFTSVPTDGVMSRHYPSNTLATNSPINYNGAAGSVNLAPMLLAGDFNGDTVVNGLDLVEWRSDFGVDDGSDADGDIDSDGEDFLIWQRQLGRTSAASLSSSALPEPATAWLAGAGALAMLSMKSAVALADRKRRPPRLAPLN
jgi:hypothetical protein